MSIFSMSVGPYATRSGLPMTDSAFALLAAIRSAMFWGLKA
jgi:hypothetical protein